MKPKRPERKLFLWPEILGDYSPGVAFAIAESVVMARVQIVAEYMRDCPGRTEEDARAALADIFTMEPDVYDLSEPIGFYLWGGA